MQITASNLLALWLGLSFGIALSQCVFGKKEKILDSIVDTGAALLAVYLVNYFATINK